MSTNVSTLLKPVHENTEETNDQEILKIKEKTPDLKMKQLILSVLFKNAIFIDWAKFWNAADH